MEAADTQALTGREAGAITYHIKSDMKIVYRVIELSRNRSQQYSMEHLC